MALTARIRTIGELTPATKLSVEGMLMVMASGTRSS